MLLVNYAKTELKIKRTKKMNLKKSIHTVTGIYAKDVEISNKCRDFLNESLK